MQTTSQYAQTRISLNQTPSESVLGANTIYTVITLCQGTFLVLAIVYLLLIANKTWLTDCIGIQASFSDKCPGEMKTTNSKERGKGQEPYSGGIPQGPCAQASELQGNDRPVFWLFFVTVFVKAQLHSSLHGQDLGSTVPIQAFHLGLAPFPRLLRWGLH